MQTETITNENPDNGNMVLSAGYSYSPSKCQLQIFNEPGKVRTLGFYEPFGSLMLHGKIETRWVRKGKKPPFPLGKYLFYTTKNACDDRTLYQWCGLDIMHSITNTLGSNKKNYLNGMAIGVGELVEVRLMKKEDEPLSFVDFIGEKLEIIDDVEIVKVQWALVFKKVKAIEPFDWKNGKQGVGFLPIELHDMVKGLSGI